MLDAYTTGVTKSPELYESYVHAQYHIYEKKYDKAKQEIDKGLKIEVNNINLQILSCQLHTQVDKDRYADEAKRAQVLIDNLTEENKKKIFQEDLDKLNDKMKDYVTPSKTFDTKKPVTKVDDTPEITNDPVPQKQFDIVKCSRGLCTATNDDNKWGFINSNNEYVTPLKYDVVKAFDDGYARVCYKRTISQTKGKQKLWGLINAKGDSVLAVKYNEIYTFSKNRNYLFIVKHQENGEQKVGLFSKRLGKLIIPVDYMGISPPSEDIIWVRGYRNEYWRSRGTPQWGFYNIANDMAIFVTEPFYDKYSNFQEGKAKVSSMGRVFIIDKKNKCVEGCY